MKKIEAFDRKTSIKKITGLARPLVEHLAKCFLYPDSKFYRGWISELRSWYNQILDIVAKANPQLDDNSLVRLLDQQIEDQRMVEKLYAQVTGDNKKLKPIYKKTDLGALHANMIVVINTMVQSLLEKKSFEDFVQALEIKVHVRNNKPFLSQKTIDHGN